MTIQSRYLYGKHGNVMFLSVRCLFQVTNQQLGPKKLSRPIQWLSTFYCQWVSSTFSHFSLPKRMHPIIRALFRNSSSPWFRWAILTLVFARSDHGSAGVRSSAGVEALAPEEHQHHPLWKSRVPENHRGWAPHLQERLRGLRLPWGCPQVHTTDVHVKGEFHACTDAAS